MATKGLEEEIEVGEEGERAESVPIGVELLFFFLGDGGAFEAFLFAV